jgi:hypothetical protein
LRIYVLLSFDALLQTRHVCLNQKGIKTRRYTEVRVFLHYKYALNVIDFFICNTVLSPFSLSEFCANFTRVNVVMKIITVF